MFGNLLPRIVEIARDAGQAIMEIYADPVMTVEEKADSSPLTLADLASDRVIGRGLEKLGLGPVLSEESSATDYAERRNWRRYWLVDPLDGTKEFVKRNGEFTVNIALVENGEPVLGVVYAPVLEVCYFAAQGMGAFVRRGSQKMEAIRVRERMPNAPLRVVASRSHSDARTVALLEMLGEHETISMGSSLKLCLVAEGRAHLYPRLGPTMEWDTAAAHAIVKQAGGRVCDIHGAELVYNKADLHNPEFFVFSSKDQALFGQIQSAE